jgi:hypothetical protein
MDPPNGFDAPAAKLELAYVMAHGTAIQAKLFIDRISREREKKRTNRGTILR